MSHFQRQLLALGLIALGGLWFLVSIGALSGTLLSVLVRFWPVLLIGVGLDMLSRQRVFNLPYTVLAVIGLALYALIGAPGPGGRVVQETLRESLNGAQRAEVNLDLSSATVTLGAAAPDTLIEADIRDTGRTKLEVRGGETKRVDLEHRRNRAWNRADFNRHWTISLSPQIPIDLDVEGASGAVDLDLRDLRVTEAELDLYSGATTLRLPGRREPTKVSLEGGSGSVSVDAPDGANLQLQAELGSGASTFILGEVDYAELALDSGSGSVTIDVPENANVKLEVDDDASGSLNLPAWLAPESGDGDEGVWQTEGFDPSEGQILIRFEDRGSGSITLK